MRMSDARKVALEVLRRVSTQGAYTGAALRALLPSDWSSADRGLATELVYGVLRRRGHLDRALRKAAGRRLKDLDPRLHDVLRLGAYQIIFLDKVPAHAAVHTAVELAKVRGGPRGASRVNQVLRALSDTRPEARIPEAPPLHADPAGHVAAEGSVSAEVASVLVEALGAESARAFVLASLEPAPHVLRTNLLRTTPEALRAELSAEPGSLAYSIRLPEGLRQLPAELDAVREGRASPQDEASMRVVELLGPSMGETILDVCAAPGGKTCHAAERMKDHGRVLAHDRLPERLRRVRENAERLGLTAVEIHEVLPPEGAVADKVLIDAPCSGLGTLRRHPEIRWRFTRADLEPLGRTQDKVLRAGAARVRLGGILVYSVCTVTPAEGPERARSLEGFALEEELLTGPQDPGAPDGFYAARLRRVA